MILVVFSLAFYAWGEPRWVILLVFSALVDYVNGRMIEKHRGTWKATAALVSSITINLALLFFFKYAGFFAQNLNLVLGTRVPVSNFSLPIGISFYTFQTLSYTIDVYRNETRAQPSFLKFMLFVSLFHQLVAGPIVRYSDIAAEIDNRTVSLADISCGINRFATGLAKKVLLANTAGELAGAYLDGNLALLSTGGAWLGIMLFSLQIYFDFSGYSDMAIGLGRMIGFHYKENFNIPILRNLLQISGAGGIFHWAAFSEITCTFLWEETESAIFPTCSSCGFSPAFGTGPAGISLFGTCFTAC